MALRELTKWLLDKLDETGISKFLPMPKGTMLHTPEEENAYMLQGDTVKPDEKEDHINHIRVHSELIADPTIPDTIRKEAIRHSQEHAEMLKKLITQQIIASRMPQQPQTGGLNAEQIGAGAPGAPSAVLPQVGGMAGPQAGNSANI
jgi:hypothetical protein